MHVEIDILSFGLLFFLAIARGKRLSCILCIY